VEIVISKSQPKTHGSYLSPDGQWQAEIVIYDCVQTTEQDTNAYEQLKLINTADKRETMIDSQFLNCGGMGAYGLDGLVWASNSRYFYYTNAREGVPDGCSFWERPLFRVDVNNQQVEKLGSGPVSPDGSKLATRQGQDLVVWEINGAELGRTTVAIQQAGLGPIAWSPDSQKLVYLQSETLCPPTGNSYLVEVAPPDYESKIVLESKTSTFGRIEWDTANQLRLFDENEVVWHYDFATQTLAPVEPEEWKTHLNEDL
jgi:hypothetical protein